MSGFILLILVCGLAFPLAAQSPGASKRNAAKASIGLLRLHERLRNPLGDSHDDYISARYVGNETTVPLLIERLRRDFPQAEPKWAPNIMPGYDCAQLHLIDALRIITNTDQGLFYPAWAKWFEANQQLSREVWIHNGFIASGLHPVSPPDERFVLELIELLGGKRWHLAQNAQQLLDQQGSKQISAWAGMAARSENRQVRLGALRLIGENRTVEAEVLIRSLTSDPDGEIREQAATLLNHRHAVSRH